MKDEINEETFFKELMSKSKLEHPFPDFEDKVMNAIELKKKKSGTIQRDLRLSWIFFLLGSLFGVAISVILPKHQETFLGMNINNLATILQIGFTFLFVTQLNYLIDIYKKIKSPKL